MRADESILLRDGDGLPSPIFGWTWVAILVLAYVCSYLDRQILSLMVDRIKADLHISDGQFGLLHGLSFALLYSIAGLPLGGLVDRYPRRTIIVSGVLVWSLMTGICGLSRQFFQLFLARVGVGVGEAALSPAAYSLLADCFDKRRLGLALSVYFAGAGLGAGLAFMLGGALIGLIDNFAPVSLPLIGALATWQLVFLAVAMLGIPVALAVYLISEPLRRGQTAVQAPNWGSVLRYLWARRRFILPFYIGMSCVAAVSLGGLSWFAALLMRSYGLSVREAGLQLGIVTLTAIPLGTLCGALLSQMLDRRGVRNAAMLVCFGSTIPMIGAAVLMLAAQGQDITTLAIFFSMALSSLPFGIAAATLQSILPNEMRGRSSALLLLCQNGLGMVFGPLIPGLLSDHLFGDPKMIAVALPMTLAGFGVCAAILQFTAYRNLEDAPAK